MLTTAPRRSPIYTSFLSLLISTRLLRIKRILGQQIPLNLRQLQRGRKAQIYDTSQPSYPAEPGADAVMGHTFTQRPCLLNNTDIRWRFHPLFSLKNHKRRWETTINNDHVAIMAYNRPGTSAGLHPLLLIIFPYLFLIKLFFLIHCHFSTSHHLLKKGNIPSFFWICTKVQCFFLVPAPPHSS